MDPIPPTIMLTFDIEDWFQVENLRPIFPVTTWNKQQLRVEQNTHKILDLLDSITSLPNSANARNLFYTPKGTFFILGWIAERCPQLIKEIVDRGHEVASHGHNHMMCNHLKIKDLKEDLIRSKKTIEDITGIEVKGYRAPSFSISDSTLELVRMVGYRYDSSYNNFSRHGRYGTISVNGSMNSGQAIRIEKNFVELPISNLEIGLHTLPWGGGGYFRFLPPLIFKAGVKHILKQSNTYTFYIHPWELDPHQPRVKNLNMQSSWRHYLNLNKTQSRLHNLITVFKQCIYPTCSQYINKFILPTV